MAQQVGTLATKPYDLSSISRIHMVEGDNGPSQMALWPPHAPMWHMNPPTLTHSYTYIHTYK